ncbi:MAG: hypothetical protein ACFCUL_14515 [Flavobacteriaceae bacterium]
MKVNLKVEKNYSLGFNLGYELARELNLKVPMFKSLNSEDKHLNAIKNGMAQYQFEISQTNINKNTLGLNNKDNDSEMYNEKDNGKGFDLSI